MTSIDRRIAEGDDATAAFARRVLGGLAAAPKRLEPRDLYDRVGAKLFEAITELDAYYPTRTELSLLQAHARDLFEGLGDGLTLIEPGSGEGTKVRILLDALGRRVESYIPIDIAAAQLEAFAEGLAATYPDLEVVPLAADFAQPITLPDVAARGRRVLFFPGSTIGNMTRGEAEAFLARMRRAFELDDIVIGIDPNKDVATLIEAYDDPAGVTAAFNRNILQRINRELGGTFDLSNFEHEARYNAAESRVEMHLRARSSATVSVAGARFAFEAGETIHTESSHKYAPEDFAALAERSGWASRFHVSEPKNLFSIHVLSAL